MDNRILKRMKRLSLQNRKDMNEIGLKLAEETGEVTQAILSANKAQGSSYKKKNISDVKEEAVDVMLVALSLFYFTGGTNEEMQEIFETKMNKWERVIQIKE